MGTHKIKLPIVEVEEVEQYLQHLQNNLDRDNFPMSNPTIRSTQIAECEIAYSRIVPHTRHI